MSYVVVNLSLFVVICTARQGFLFCNKVIISNAIDMRVTQDLNSFGEIIAHAHCSVDEKNEN
jgi:hypothetical protein